MFVDLSPFECLRMLLGEYDKLKEKAKDVNDLMELNRLARQIKEANKNIPTDRKIANVDKMDKVALKKLFKKIEKKEDTGGASFRVYLRWLVQACP